MRIFERWFGTGLMILFVAVLVTGFTAQLQHGTVVHGAGASFPAPLYSRWIALFERQNPDIDITYEAVGSGAGIEAITTREVHFGASDALLNEDEIEELPDELLQIPMALGPVVIAYNLPALSERITLDSETIVDIYFGNISAWNDERITELNPDIELPATPVRVAHRSDSSGTTSIFTSYLTAVSDEWASEIGRGKVVEWPISHGAGRGNDGVAQQILLRPGGIGYLELTYAENAGLEFAALVNREGEVVLPSVESVQAAELNTPAEPGEIIKPSIVNAPGADSYPIAGFTYLLVYRDLSYIDDPHIGEAILHYLEWVLTEGQVVAPELVYTPLPESLREAAFELVETITVVHEEEA